MNENGNFGATADKLNAERTVSSKAAWPGDFTYIQKHGRDAPTTVQCAAPASTGRPGITTRQ
jgi:hypothetical protein